MVMKTYTLEMFFYFEARYYNKNLMCFEVNDFL